MRLYLKQNVWDAALDRIRWLYDEFDHVQVCFSGGKDSTVLANLTVQVAREKGRLPVPLLFIDQEFEWQAAIEYVRRTMHREEFEPRWVQTLITSSKHIISGRGTGKVQHCWTPGGPWTREKEQDSLKLDFGTTDFFQIMAGSLSHFYPEGRACNLGGVRGAESSGRIRAVTSDVTYKGVTWGKIIDRKKHYYDFYPLYDWSVRDVWKAIGDNGWDYCELYDRMFQQGYSLDDMRISDLYSSTSVRHLQRLAELEPETWERIVGAIEGASALSHLQEQFTTAKELPEVFVDWVEYRDYLLEHLVPKEDWLLYQKRFAAYEARFGINDSLTRYMVNSILVGDREGTRLRNWASEFDFYAKNARTRRNPLWKK